MPNSRPFRGGQWKCVNLFPAAFGGSTTTAAVLASQPSLAIYQVALSNKAFAGTACWGRRRTTNNAKYLQGYCFATTLLLHFRSLQQSWAIPIINSSSSLLFPGRGAVFVGGVNLDNVPGEEAAAVGRKSIEHRVHVKLCPPHPHLAVMMIVKSCRGPWLLNNTCATIRRGLLNRLLVYLHTHGGSEERGSQENNHRRCIMATTQVMGEKWQ